MLLKYEPEGPSLWGSRVYEEDSCKSLDTLVHQSRFHRREKRIQCQGFRMLGGLCFCLFASVSDFDINRINLDQCFYNGRSRKADFRGNGGGGTLDGFDRERMSFIFMRS